jgi:hypothetical protein
MAHTRRPPTRTCPAASPTCGSGSDLLTSSRMPPELRPPAADAAGRWRRTAPHRPPTGPGRSRAWSGAGSPPLGWQPSQFLTDRAEAVRTFALAEHLGSVNAAAAELGTTWPSLRKAFQRHGLGMPLPTPKQSASGPEPPPASAAGSRPPRPWTRCLLPSILAPSRLESDHRPSCMSGSAATSSTPPWAPTSWSSYTAKATPASPPGHGRSSAGLTAATE